MNIATVEENKNNIVKKHQDLIHNARYRLSELGIKVLSVLISMVRVSDEEFTQYAIKISDFKELIGSDSNNTYKYAHRLVRELMSHPMQIGDEQFNWVSYGKYSRGDNYIVFEIHRKLKPYLLELQQNFLQYNIANILQLRSGYVIRLYELCKDHYTEATRYKPKQKSVQFELKIDRMRELFEIPKSYQYSSGIKLRILDKAVRQFKEKTDIQISYTEQKIGRKVDRIIITVRANDKGSADPLRNRHGFIDYVRKHYYPEAEKGIYPAIVEASNGTIKLTNERKIYITAGAGDMPSTLDHTQSDKLWNWLFDGVQSGEFELIPPPERS